MKSLVFCVLTASLLRHHVQASDPRDIIDYLIQENYTRIVDLINKAGIADDLRHGPYTLFVPTDRAFDALPDVVTQKIMSNTTVFKHILLSHITSGILVGPQIFNGQVINSLSGRQLHMGRMANGSLSVDGATVSGADQIVRNGVIHTIDRVLLPASQTITEYLSTHDFTMSSLYAAVILADLASTLQTGTYTLFAPNDHAFEAIKPILPNLLADNYRFRGILKQHIVSGSLFSSGMTSGQTIATLHGSHLQVGVGSTGFGLSVDQANIVDEDNPMTNGVIHIIDKVLLR